MFGFKNILLENGRQVGDYEYKCSSSRASQLLEVGRQFLINRLWSCVWCSNSFAVTMPVHSLTLRSHDFLSTHPTFLPCILPLTSLRLNKIKANKNIMYDGISTACLYLKNVTSALPTQQKWATSHQLLAYPTQPRLRGKQV